MADAFQPRFVDLVRNYTTTTGTADFKLGTVVNGYTGFIAACAVGDQFYYSAIGVDKPSECEVGRGTLLANGVIARDPIGGVKTNFSIGTKSIALIAAAEWYQSAQQLVSSITVTGQALATASTPSTARGVLGLGSASLADIDSDASLTADSDTKIPTQKAVKSYVDSHGAGGALIASNNLSDVASPATARTNLGLGSAATENLDRFPVTLLDRAALGGYSAGTTAYLREAGREGLFAWSGSSHATEVANDPQQGVYVAPTSDPTGATGAWVRQYSGMVDVRWFGAVADNVTDDGPAFLAAIAFLKAIRLPAAIYTRASQGLFVPAGHYYLGTSTLDLTHTLTIQGEGIGSYGDSASVLRWADAATGIRVQFYNTTGATGTTGNATPSEENAGGSIIRRLALKGGYTGTESEAHGIHLRTMATIEDVQINGFSGDGLYIVNGNGSQINRLTAENCRNGIRINDPLSDSNVIVGVGVNVNNNRRWGLWDGGGLGNSWIGAEAAANGNYASGAAGSIPTACYYGGNNYYVKKDQGAWCSTNAPSGTTASNTGWIWSAAAGGAGASTPLWTTGQTWRDGGCYRVDGASTCGAFIGCYTEPNNNPPQLDGPTIIVGGLLSSTGTPWGGTIRGGSDSISINGGLSLGGNITTSGSATLGPTTGPATDINYTFNNTNAANFLNLVSNYGGVPSTDGVIRSFRGAGLTFYGIPKITLSTGNADIAQIIDTGLDMLSGKSLKLNGVTALDGSTGYLTAAVFPALTGEVAKAAGSLATTVLGAATATGSFLTSGGSIGYRTGAGGSVVQATSKSTGVTLNTACGSITMSAAALAANAIVEFTVTNSAVAASDTINLNLKSGATASTSYRYWVSGVAAGSFKVCVENRSAGSLSEALVLNFAIVKAVAA